MSHYAETYRRNIFTENRVDFLSYSSSSNGDRLRVTGSIRARRRVPLIASTMLPYLISFGRPTAIKTFQTNSANGPSPAPGIEPELSRYKTARFQISSPVRTGGFPRSGGST